MFPLNILKDLHLHDKGKCKTELRNFFFSDFLLVTTRYFLLLEIWQDVALEFCRKQNKDISILTKIYVIHDQLHHIRNNCFGPILFSPGDSRTRGLHLLIHSGFEGVTEVNIDPKKKVCGL